MFKLKSIKATNFRSYKKLELNNIDKLGLILLTGKNGAGKSTIRHLIEYLLTDRTSENIPLDELTLNSKGNCKIEGVFERDDGVEIKIEKYREHKKHINQTILTIDGVLDKYTTTDRRSTQRNIEDVFGITPEIVNISTIFSQFSNSFPEVKESERKKIIYDAKNLNKYKIYEANAKEKRVKLEDELQKINNELTNCQSLLSTYRDDIDNNIVESENDQENKLTKIDELSETKVTFERGIKEETEVIESLERQVKVRSGVQDKIHELDLRLNNINNRYKEVKRLLKEREALEYANTKGYAAKVHSLIVSLIDYDKEGYNNLKVEIAKIERSKIQLESDIRVLEDKLKGVSDGTCPILKTECDRLLNQNEELISEYQPKLDTLNQQLVDFNNDLKRKEIENETIEMIIGDNKEKNKEIDKVNRKIELIEKDNAFSDKRKIEIDGLINGETLELFSKQKEIIEEDKELLKDDKKEYDAAKELLSGSISKKDILLLNALNIDNQIKTLKDSKNPYTKIIEQMTTKLKDEESKKEGLTTKVKETNELLKYYVFWERGYGKSGIPNMKSDSFLDDIEMETNKILSSVSRMHVEIDSQTDLKSKEVREKISYKVFHPDKTIKDYFSYSGGQRQRVVIADKFAFSNLLSNFNFIIMDEVLELSLDEQGKNDVPKILKQKLEDLDTIFVISHDDSIRNQFDNVINIELKNGVSQISQ